MSYKKLFTMILILVVALSFVACGEINNEKTNQIAEISPVTEQPIEVAEEESEQGGWRSAYAEFLQKDEWPGVYGNYDNPRFALVYVTDDDVPELVIGGGNYHAAGAHLYTYIDGEVVPVMTEGENARNNYGDYGSLHYKERGNRIGVFGMSMGYESTAVVEIDGSSAKTLISLSNDEGARAPGETVTYKVNNKPVTREEYDEASDSLDFGDYTYLDYTNMLEINEESLKLLALS